MAPPIEYKVVEFDTLDLPGIESLLNELAVDGWELIIVTGRIVPEGIRANGVAYLRRKPVVKSRKKKRAR